MQLTFDPRDPNAATAALAVILALNPEIQVPGTVMTGEQFRANVREVVADAHVPEYADPAAAFGGVDPAAAFAGNAPAPAPAATSPIADPASASAPAVPASNGTPASSNGPTAAIASPTSAPAGVDVDGEGLPWDKRIHSDPPKKNADGKWRSKRNLDKAVYDQVAAELRQVMGAPAAPIPAAPAVGGAPSEPAPAATAPIPAPPAPTPTPDAANMASGPGVATPVNEAPAVPVAAPVPAPPVVPAAPVAAVPTPPAPTAGGAVSFADLMRKITGLQTAGTLTVAGTAEISAALGITGVRDLMHRPDLIPAFDSLLPVAA